MTSHARYELLGPLGKGGMAEVLLARTVGPNGFERLLAVKRILPVHAQDPAHVKMFLDEARNAARLAHHRIVQVFDIELRDGVLLYAMEYLHGQTLSEVLAREPRLPQATAVAVAIAVADGLHHAHQRQPPVVHRDVAPSNVMLTYDGNIKLIDFGIAKAADNLASTMFGTFKGRLGYSSPEQVRCERVDARTDVYSLCVLLYELSTGRPAFAGDDEEELIARMCDAAIVPPRTLDPAYPAALEAIVMKGLARERDRRHASAGELRDELDAFARGAHLNVSEPAMVRLMARLFARELEPWQSAHASGLSLEQFVVDQTLRERPPELAPLTLDGTPMIERAPGASRRAAAGARWAIRTSLVIGLIALGYLVARLVGG